MNKPFESGATEIHDKKKRYSAGVLKYRQMGYWDGDYEPPLVTRQLAEAALVDIHFERGVPTAINGVPKRLTKFCATPAAHVINTGKNTVNITIGVIMRQSRNVSRSSRRTISHIPLNQLMLA